MIKIKGVGNVKLCEVSGQKIRMQYLNWLVFGETTALLALMLVATVLWILGRTPFSEWLDGGFVLVVLFFPLYLFSLLNRFCFGKVICVLNEEGIHYMDHQNLCCIPWEDVSRLEYEPQRKGWFGHWCNVKVWGERDLLATISHAPYMTMTQARKYKKDLKIGIDSWVWWGILLFFGILLVLWVFSVVAK